MAEYEVDQVWWNPEYSRRMYGAIMAVSGQRQGKRWYLPSAEVLHRVRGEVDVFLIRTPHGVVWLDADLGPDGLFLRTWTGTAWSDDLLALPDCRRP